MTLANQEIPSAPLDRATADQQYNRLVAAVQLLQQYVGDNLRGPQPGVGRPSSLDIFFGYTTSQPPNTSTGDLPMLVGAQYFVVRSVAPDPTFGAQPNYDQWGSLEDSLSVNDDPFNKVQALPPYVIASNLGETPGGTKGGQAGTGTKTLPDNTIVLCIGFPSRQNPMQRTYVFDRVILPNGQYQYMAYVTVSQNQSGFDFIRAHPLI